MAAGSVAVGPELERTPVRLGQQGTDQGLADSLPPAGRIDHELAAYLRLRGIQVSIGSDLAVHGDDEITARARIRPSAGRDGAVVAQMQQHVLRQGCHPVSRGGAIGQLQDGGDLRGIQIDASNRPSGHRAAVAA